jgi:aldehyde:ferredoxin oxidoreductase
MMKELYGPSNKVIEIDLSSRTVNIYTVTEQERKLYLGGKGLGLKLLYDRMKPGIDPMGEENILAVMPGVLMGTGAACSGRFAAVTKSPLTGIFASSSCGGPFGMSLKTAGWDGLLIKGKSPKAVYLYITAEGAEFRDAENLWGMDALSAQKQITDKNSDALVIGPAGENGVRFANIVTGERHIGRTGMGAVMGSKYLKAAVAKGGDFRIIPKNQARFDKIKKKAASYIKSNPMTSQVYTAFGTPANTNLSNSAGILPVKNFSEGMHDEAYKISGESMQEHYLTRHHTCKPCSIMCGKKGTFGDRSLPVPEFETVGLMGANIGVFDPVRIAEWSRICSEMGMDTISTGSTLAWIMEASEKGLIKSNLKFGSPEGVSEALHDIAYGRGLGKDMACGVRALSQKYGGEEFAIHVKGLEMAAYDPRGAFGQGLSYAVANRGACHLSAFMVALEVYFNLLKPYTTSAKPEFVRFFESLTCCINSLHTCQFTMYAYTFEPPLTRYTPKTLLGFMMQNLPGIAVKLVDFSIYTSLWSAVTGIEISDAEFLKAGDRIHVLERYMNTREGISRKDDTLPPRLLKEGRKSDPNKRTVPLEKMLDKYYKIRGYDSNGIPTESTLKRLGISYENDIQLPGDTDA